MITLDELRQKAEEERARQLANPAGSPKTHRSAGGVMLILGIVLTVVNALSWMMAGRFFILLLATNIVFLGAGIYMLATGKNPFKKI